MQGIRPSSRTLHSRLVTCSVRDSGGSTIATVGTHPAPTSSPATGGCVMLRFSWSKCTGQSTAMSQQIQRRSGSAKNKAEPFRSWSRTPDPPCTRRSLDLTFCLRLSWIPFLCPIEHGPVENVLRLLSGLVCFHLQVFQNRKMRCAACRGLHADRGSVSSICFLQALLHLTGLFEFPDYDFCQADRCMVAFGRRHWHNSNVNCATLVWSANVDCS